MSAIRLDGATKSGTANASIRAARQESKNAVAKRLAKINRENVDALINSLDENNGLPLEQFQTLSKLFLKYTQDIEALINDLESK